MVIMRSIVLHIDLNLRGPDVSAFKAKRFLRRFPYKFCLPWYQRRHEVVPWTKCRYYHDYGCDYHVLYKL